LSENKSNSKASKSKTAGSAPSQPAGGPMDVSVLEKLVKLMRANDLTTLEVADGERRILLKRGGEPAAYLPAAAPAKSVASAPASSAVVVEPEPDAALTQIRSIMVGTFYAAANPDSQPFVQVGSTVDEETDVCVIEAMKVFNTIKAECRGTIAKILVTNGQSVEFGQALFLVKP
jgi:acetyl-CoA carboxylase biotin carboxyl carrier protein